MMSAAKSQLPYLAVLALLVQLMTPWQALHLGMMEVGNGALAHAHCPTQSTGEHSTQAMDHHGGTSTLLTSDDVNLDESPNTFSDTCERACGLTLTEAIFIALSPITSGSTAIDAQDAFPSPLFVKVPNPPPIA